MSRTQISTRSSHSLTSADLLVKNLRLLDLDEEFDWPGIHATTFSAADSVKNLNKRLYTAAWIFYKLFEAYEPEKTKRELSDLFPPLEPKQSSLLRAAIFKRLYDLKLAGFFGKDVVVRKTLFDDCKGPKFEELMAVFSAAVLIKVIEQDTTDRSIVKASICSSRVDLDCASIVLAYRISLARQLHTREVLQRRLKKFSSNLKHQEDLLDQRSKQLTGSTTSSSSKRIPSRTLARLRRLLNENWKGDGQWVGILFESDQHRPSGKLIETSFTEVWKYARSDTLYALRPKRDDSLLQSLEARVAEQRTRLDRWRKLQTSIANKAENRQPVAESSSLRVAEGPEKKYSLRSKAGDIPAAMPVQRASHRRMVSQAYDHKSPPSTHATRDSKHRRSRSAMVETPKQKTPSPPQTVMARKPLANTGIRLSSSSQLRRPQTSYGTIAGLSKGNISDRVAQRSLRPSASVSEQEEDDSSVAPSVTSDYDDIGVADIVNSILNAEPSPYKAPLTLAERTRMSMATRTTRQEPVQPQKPAYNDHVFFTESIPATPNAALSSLAERTRQSMSIRNPTSRPTPVRQHSATKAIPSYPVNQFETPRKPVAADDTFFDETIIDLDEADIFKSRPKVAVSPTLSPMLGQQDMLGIGAVLEEMDYDDDDEYEDDFS